MLVDYSASFKDVADVITPHNTLTNTFHNSLALVSIWFERRAEVSRKAFPRP